MLGQNSIRSYLIAEASFLESELAYILSIWFVVCWGIHILLNSDVMNDSAVA